MKRSIIALGVMGFTIATAVCATAPAAASTNAPVSSTTNKVEATKAKADKSDSTAPSPATTSVTGEGETPSYSLTNTTQDLIDMVLKPPTGDAPVVIIPSQIDNEPPPPLSEDAKKHQYIGFRLGMTPDEAKLVAQGKDKKLDEVEKNKFRMEGCLTCPLEKGKTVLTFKDGKLDIIMIYWDDNNSLFITLERSLNITYGKPLKVDELFRRYWKLANGDWIRLFYNIGSHQTSLVYASKKSLFELNEQEKIESKPEIPGL